MRLKAVFSRTLTYLSVNLSEIALLCFDFFVLRQPFTLHLDHELHLEETLK